MLLKYIKNLLIICLFYYSYRYPLQINSSDTSPTYTDTPLVLQLFKYVLILGLTFYFFIVSNKKNIKLPKNAISTIYFIIILFLINRIIYFNAYPYEVGFSFFVSFSCIIIFDKRIHVNFLYKYIKFGILLLLVINFLQIILFVFWERLPALAYKGSLSVRFGSLFDAPNTFGLILSFGYGIKFHNKVKYFIYLMLLTTCLLLTQSLTAIGSVFLAINTLLIIKYKRLSVLLLYLFLIILLSITVYFAFDYLIVLWKLKYPSILEHIYSVINLLVKMDLSNLLGVKPILHRGETSYINLFANYGFIFLIAYLIFHINALFKLFQRVDINRKVLPILYFLLTTLYAKINLPLEVIFPINIIEIVLLTLINFDYLNYENRLYFKLSD